MRYFDFVVLLSFGVAICFACDRLQVGDIVGSDLAAAIGVAIIICGGAVRLYRDLPKRKY